MKFIFLLFAQIGIYIGIVYLSTKVEESSLSRKTKEGFHDLLVFAIHVTMILFILYFAFGYGYG